MLLAAAQAVGGIAKVRTSLPFLAGFGIAAAIWAFGTFFVIGGPAGFMGSALSRLYVVGHELTHALAAWSVGAKVLGFKVGENGGHVDLSHSNAYIALAPYFVPIYTIMVVAGYRLLLWAKPDLGGREYFLAALGLSLAFHFIKTIEVLWKRKQPDIAAAGGMLFSFSWIALLNGFVVLVLLKSLFPSWVDLSASLRGVAGGSAAFWGGAYGIVKPLQEGFASQLKRP